LYSWLQLCKPIVIILRDDPLDYLFFTPAVVACWLATKLLETSSGAKSSRLGTLKRFLENVFENLGVVFTPLKCFQKWFWTDGDGHGE
jgi:hypothetical protein